MGTSSAKPQLPIENLGEQHLPCVILVDTSYSMRGYESKLHEAIQDLKNAIMDDDIARGRVEVCLITFDDDVREESPFCPISKMKIPAISCGGMTRTHKAMKFALQKLAERKQAYIVNHVMYNQPWICLLTDGESNDTDNGAFVELLKIQRASKCVFFGIAIGDQVNEKELAGMHKDGIIFKVEKDSISKAFEFISQSINPASAHNPGEKIKVEIPDSIEVKQIKDVIPNNIEDEQIEDLMPNDIEDEKQKDDIGLWVNTPARIKVKLIRGTQPLYSYDFNAGQFGRTEVLSGALFGRKQTCRIVLNPLTGGIESIKEDNLEH